MSNIIGVGAPYTFDHINASCAQEDPSSLHIQNTRLNRFFVRYLMQKAISIFEWKIPEHWAKNYFLYVLYTWGWVAVIETDKFGVIPQGCGLQGYDVFYQPTEAVISNPVLTGIMTPRIGQDCTIIKLQPDYGGVYDLVSYYANLMAICAETACTNIFNSKLSYVFFAKNKTFAESFKKLYDKVASGEPMAVIDKNLFGDDDQKLWEAFTQDLKGNYIANDILETMRTLEMRFCQELGIPTVINEKKERLNIDETNGNNIETYSRPDLWLEELKKCCKETRDMFGIEIDVDWRFQNAVKDMTMEVSDNG